MKPESLGHPAPFNFDKIQISILAVGQAVGLDTNIGYYNIDQVCDPSTGCVVDQLLGPNAVIVINGCRAGVRVPGITDGSDPSGLSQQPIARLLARQLKRKVTAYMVGTYFSLKNAADANSRDWTGEPNPLPVSLPMYLIPEGTSKHKKGPTEFKP